LAFADEIELDPHGIAEVLERGDSPALRLIIAFCHSIAQRTASTTPRHSASAPLPVRFTTRHCAPKWCDQ
jgi:hypothetical protein